MDSGFESSPGRVLWQWCENDGIYINYNPLSNAEIERAYIAGEDSCDITVDNTCFTIQIRPETCMAQVSKRGATRKVRRRDLDALPIGERWDHMTCDELSSVCLVHPKSADFHLVCNVLFDRAQEGSITRATADVVCVRRVQNRCLLGEFEAKRKNIQQLRGAHHLNEQCAHLLRWCELSAAVRFIPRDRYDQPI